MIRHGRRLWRAADALAEHATSRSWLEHQLDRRSAGPVVVVTHTAPSLRSIAERYQDDLLSAAFASDLETFAARANLWVHGHTHIGCDYVLGDCRVVNNPRGYVDEGESERFDRSLVCTFGPV
jgi:hypothetical protein